MKINTLERHARNELKYQLRGKVSREIRKSCPHTDPMVLGITVMLGTFLAMEAFNNILGFDSQCMTR